MDEGIVLTVVGIVVSVAVTWFFSRRYYQKALEDSAATNNERKGELRELRQSFAVITRAMEQDGTLARAMQQGGFTIRRNDAGEPIGLVYERSFHVSQPSSVTLETKVIRAHQDDSTAQDPAAASS